MRTVNKKIVAGGSPIFATAFGVNKIPPDATTIYVTQHATTTAHALSFFPLDVLRTLSYSECSVAVVRSTGFSDNNHANS